MPTSRPFKTIGIGGVAETAIGGVTGEATGIGGAIVAGEATAAGGVTVVIAVIAAIVIAVRATAIMMAPGSRSLHSARVS